MRANRRRDTGPELAIRRMMHRAGLRYRVDFPIRPDDGRVVRPDVAFTRVRLAVFIDGCFWHGCPEHHRLPGANVDYWSTKVARTQERDLRDSERMRNAGWFVLRFWEHEEPESVLGSVERMLARLEAAAHQLVC
jgi:DNA mismatch endonuclease, patch repair protein